MRVLIVAALLAGCTKKAADPPPPPPAPLVDICDLGTRALEHVTCGPGSGAAIGTARKTFVGFVEAIRKATQADAHQFQIMCASMLTALEKDTAKAGCTIEIAPPDRKAIDSVLETYYAERTKIVPTGDLESDKVIDHVGEIRDSMCSCSTMMCLETIDKQLETIESLPLKAPQAAHDLGNKLIDDIGRCEAKIRAAAGL